MSGGEIESDKLVESGTEKEERENREEEGRKEGGAAEEEEDLIKKSHVVVKRRPKKAGRSNRHQQVGNKTGHDAYDVYTEGEGVDKFPIFA